MKKHLLTLLILIGIFKQSNSQINDTTSLKLKKAITDFKNKYQSPGIVVAVVHDKEIIFTEAQGYTDLENKIPATIDSKYPIMSVTKTFTATMLMQLVAHGTVNLDDEVKKYVPEYKVKSDFPQAVTTTLFQLATHTSGLPRKSLADIDFTVSWDRWMLSDKKDSLQWFSTDKALLQSLQFIKLEYPPFHYLHHNDRHYSNLGYSILGIALERAAKADFRKYVTNKICKPLGMIHTGFLNDPDVNDQMAKGYRYNTATKTTETIPAFEPYSALYAGGMYSTARDMSKYLSFQFDDHSNVLSPDSKAMMRSLKIAWKPAYPYVLHEGSIPGYRSTIVFNPETKMGWVILMNTTDIDFNQINMQIANIINAIKQQPTIPDITEYAGTYRLPGGYGSLTISLKDDHLYSTYLHDLLQDKPLTSDGLHRFKAEGRDGYNIPYEFVADENSAIKALKMGQLVWYKEK